MYNSAGVFQPARRKSSTVSPVLVEPANNGGDETLAFSIFSNRPFACERLVRPAIRYLRLRARGSTARIVPLLIGEHTKRDTDEGSAGESGIRRSKKGIRKETTKRGRETRDF